jgi:hypothetical protein
VPGRPDVISSGRDPDRRGRVPWRLVAGAAAVLLAGTLGFRLLAGQPGHHRPGPRPGPSASAAGLSLPLRPLLHGLPVTTGVAPSAVLYLGGQDLRRVAIEPQRPSAAAAPVAASTSLPLGPDPAVQQIVPVSGGVVALLASHGPDGLRDLGVAVFVPADLPGAAQPRVLARANYIAAAPDGGSVWIEQAAQPWGNGPPGSPAWQVGLAGHRLSGTLKLGHAKLSAVTSRGVLAVEPAGYVLPGSPGGTEHDTSRSQPAVLISPADGSRHQLSLPAGAQILGASADRIAWQAAACRGPCPLRITNLRNGTSVSYPLPPHTAVDLADNPAFDGAGRFALALDSVSRDGVATGTGVYVTSQATGRLSQVPGARTGLSDEPAVIGALPAGATDVTSLSWSPAGPGLWVVVSDGLSYQVGYWTGAGTLRVLPVQAGLAAKLGIAGSDTAR